MRFVEWAEDVFAPLIGPVICVLTAIFCLYLVVMLGVLGVAQKDCLAAGYPVAKVDYALAVYCIRRVNQTDEVIPVDQVRAR